MTLRRKTLGIIGLTLFGLLAGFFLLTRLTISRRFIDFEQRAVRAQVDRAYTALESDKSEITTLARSQAEWDDAYDFVQSPTRRFIASNYPRGFFAQHRVRLVEYLNRSRQVVYQEMVEAGSTGGDVPPEVQAILLSPDTAIGRSMVEHEGITGIVQLPAGPMIVACYPVLRSSGDGPPMGTLIIGRYLDANEIHRLSLLTRQGEWELYRLDDPALPSDYQAVKDSLSRLEPFASRPLDNDDLSIRGYRLIDDVEGRPRLVLGITLPRNIELERRTTEWYLMAVAFVIGLVFSTVMMYLLERMVLSRLIKLGSDVATIGAQADLSARLPIVGNDEVAELSKVINGMLADLEKGEQERRKSEERYRAYITQSTEGIWRCELRSPLSIYLPEIEQLNFLRDHLYVAECNDALAKLHGLDSADRMVGLPVRDLFSTREPQNMELARKILESEYRVTDGESVAVDNKGHIRYFLNNVTGVIENGCLVRIWGTQREVTEQRRLEAQLRQAQKMEAIGRLAGGVAHDFNNLLSVIHGYTELLLRRFPEHAPPHRELEQILRATERASSLTMQLLAFGRKQVLAPRILDLNAVMRDMDRLLRRVIREDIEVVITTAGDLWLVRADPAQMEQVILNLAVNASDAISSGGRVLIETRNAVLDDSISVQDPALIPGKYVLLAVSDTGIGMDAETRARIFEPFFTTKEVGKGTGLGLATVYGIVRQSGGYISVYSEPGQGSVFRIYLPRVEGVSESAAPSPEREPVPQGSGTVLLVEDDDAVRTLATEVLRGSGYSVLSAGSGKEALGMVERNATRIDLLLTDVIMPGMAGDELVEHLRLRRPDLKVVFVSGYANDSIPRIVTNAKTSFLQKPFPVEELVRKVYEMIHTV